MKNNLFNRKGLSMPEYFFGVISSLILLVIFIIFFNILMTSCSNETGHRMSERSIENLQKEAIFLTLMSPAESPHKINFIFNQGYFKYNNLDRKLSLPLELNNQGVNFDIIANNLDETKSLILNVKPGQYSNIALINGSLDNVLPIFEEINKHPDIITWDELTNDHNYLFVGCSAPLPTNKDTLKNWINNGGTLITTDYSIELIESLFGIEYVYSNKTSLRKDPIEISFKPDAENILGLKGNHFVTNVFWVDISNKSTVLAEYKNIPDFELCRRTIDGCGEPVHYFEYGSGKVIHFSFHLDENEEIAKDFFNTFQSRFNFPSNFTIHEKDSEEIIKEFDLLSLNSENLDLIDYFIDCQEPCSKEFTIKGSGKILLRSPKLELYSTDLYLSHQYSLADEFVYSFSTNDVGRINSIKTRLALFLFTLDSEAYGHKLIISKIQNDKKIKMFEVTSARYQNYVFQKKYIVANFTLPSFNSDEYFLMELESAETVKAKMFRTGLQITLFIRWFIP